MKKFLILMSLLFSSISANSYFVPPPAPHIEEKAPSWNCFMQIKIADWQWRCYTESQRIEKLNQDKLNADIEQKNADKYRNSIYWRVQLIFVILFLLSIVAGIISLFIDNGVIMFTTLIYWVLFAVETLINLSLYK